jgi:hypothetical protein
MQLVIYNWGFKFMFSILALLFFPLLLWTIEQVVVVIARVGQCQGGEQMILLLLFFQYNIL